MHIYDNQFAPSNVYGHAAELIRLHTSGEGVHLDVGCSFGRIAEEVATIHGATYVGVDRSPEGLDSLRSRGFECHQHEFGEPAADRAFVNGILHGRTLRSVSILDTLEHLKDPEVMLRTLFELCREKGQPLIVSVPNVTHRDVGFKLAFGRWDYTEAGLLDRTHLRLFSAAMLDQMTRSIGWQQLGANDVPLKSSDQRFPPGHLALAKGSALHGLLAQLRERMPHAETNQFVRAYVPDVPSAEANYIAVHEQPQRPFLSVITRTQGRRIETLREMLLCLAAQTCADFEVLIVAHKVDAHRQTLINRVIEECSDLLGGRVRVISVSHGNRTAPLNVGFSESRGEFISMLDDDDIVLGHWVETFKKLADEHPGRMLRAVAVRQEFEHVETFAGKPSARATSGMHRDYSPRFDLFLQLAMNLTPNMALAFPRSVFFDFGLRFDETLTTTEDWDFLMRASFLCDVASTEEITCIYRWWCTSVSSRTEHEQSEWQANLERIVEKFDREYIILPPGSASRIRDLVRPPVDQALAETHVELIKALQSNAWMLTTPLRLLGRFLGNPTPITPLDVTQMTPSAAASTLDAVRSSKSMRVANALKRVRDQLERLR